MKKKILIVDDVELNRVILAEIFKDDYEIIEACDGAEAIGIINGNEEIAAVLLDLIMPNVDGLGVLRDMNQTGKIKKIPVFLITAASSEEMLLEGYNLGAVDVITKPFLPHFLRCRITGVVELYEHRNNLESLVAQQLEKIESMNQSMVETLATIIEFRDCESGEHVKRIRGLTEKLMVEAGRLYPEYYMPPEEIEKIGIASVLHDVGKIAIPDMILNKPGRLTAEEFAVMKEHTTRGCEMLEQIPADVMDEGVYRYSYDICRHHHERWDGKGYPDGLKGDEIAIWAQAVSVADVYDALTSERVYKKAYEPEKAVSMIHNGECGTFNPRLLHIFDVVMHRDDSEKQDGEYIVHGVES